MFFLFSLSLFQQIAFLFVVFQLSDHWMIWWIEAHCTICPTKVLLAEISAESNLSLEANVNRKVEFIKIMRARAKEKQSAFAYICVCVYIYGKRTCSRLWMERATLCGHWLSFHIHKIYTTIITTNSLPYTIWHTRFLSFPIEFIKILCSTSVLVDWDRRASFKQIMHQIDEPSHQHFYTYNVTITYTYERTHTTLNCLY